MSISCQQCYNPFQLTQADIDFYKRINVPSPTFCPQCRLQRRLTWRNEHSLYQRNCDLCNQPMISMYRPDSPYVVYCQDCWWSDRWDSLDYARDYNLNESFFQKYDKLRKAVPRVALTNTNSENSEYTNYAGNNKNCYLMFANALGDNENCAYGIGSGKCHDCYDTLNVYESELVYDCADSKLLHRVIGAVNCQNCTESWFIEDCNNLQNCFGCKGLRNKQYCIFNQQYSAKEYSERLQNLQLHTPNGFQAAQQRWNQFRLTVPSRYSHQLKSERCTGDYIGNSSDCQVCFDVYETERSKFIKFSITGLRDCYDVSYTGTAELGYEDLSLVDAYNCRFCNTTWWNVRDLNYCELCFNTTNCFGSISLRKQKYCILNKQYSESEYTALVKKIIQHMYDQPYVDASGRVYRYGEFPPAESVAEDFFPTQQPVAIVSGTTPADPNRQCCTQCGKAFKYIPAELQFYETMSLPLPRACFNCRHQNRLRHKNGIQLWQRQCMCKKSHHGHGTVCAMNFETTYSPERKEIVYCKHCYQQEMY